LPDTENRIATDAVVNGKESNVTYMTEIIIKYGILRKCIAPFEQMVLISYLISYVNQFEKDL